MRSLLLTFVCLVSVATTTTTAKEILPLTDSFSLFAEEYEHDIIRLTIRSKKEKVYEVKEVILPTPKESLNASCTSTKCSISTNVCSAVAELSENGLTVKHVCEGKPLTTFFLQTEDLVHPNVNFTFPSAKTLYGLAEHAADLPLRPGHTYRLYNTDAFEYPVNRTGPLYGSVPFIMAYSGASSSGVLFLNTAGMNVKIHDDFVLWEAEVGVTDLFLIPGPTPAEVQRRHAFLTGSTFLPPYFSLGYHQCRWNYLSINDCLAVDEGFDLHSIPYDVLWLDIEHTNKKEYFTWDSDEFADPLLLVEALASKGRKLVTIKDPHIRADPSYNVYREGMAENYFVKSADGVEDYVAKCWPGRSVWADVINNRTRSWYKEFFRSAFSPAPFDNVYTWVDMNEPAVFEGEGSTMHKNAIHYTNDNTTVEHRYVHNVYSFFSALTAYEGMLDTQAPSSERKRPFVLTRSFFAGSQRYAAVWNGDNMARWDHLENTIPELLSLSMSNVPFVGADVGGFLFDTEETLFVRWMQSAVFYPFMRGHAHVETKRREPWTFSPYATEIIRSAIALRYALLPYLYTTFRDAHKNGNIVLRPLVYEFPLSEELREEQHTFMFGPSILVQPIVAKEVKTITTTFPPGVWYAYHTGEALYKQHTMPVELSTMPVYLRGGHIVPMKLRLRRSSHAARFDPFTLFVALDDEKRSAGHLYLDDGLTFAYEEGVFVERVFSFSNGTLTNSAAADQGDAGAQLTLPNAVERIVVYGYTGKISSIHAHLEGEETADGIPLEFERVGRSIIIRKPGLLVNANWRVSFM